MEADNLTTPQLKSSVNKPIPMEYIERASSFVDSGVSSVRQQHNTMPTLFKLNRGLQKLLFTFLDKNWSFDTLDCVLDILSSFDVVVSKTTILNLLATARTLQYVVIIICEFVNNYFFRWTTMKTPPAFHRGWLIFSAVKILCVISSPR